MVEVVILQAMTAKFKLRTPLVWVIVCLGLSILGILRIKDYRLNRTVRNVALRLVQMETLSRTTRVDYRVVFWNNRCVMEYFDRDSGCWHPHTASAYHRGVVSDPAGLRIIFSGGRFKEYSLPGARERIPRYLILEFRIPGTPKKRGVIFYRDGDWRILG
jgi:hypothetical protein